MSLFPRTHYANTPRCTRWSGFSSVLLFVFTSIAFPVGAACGQAPVTATVRKPLIVSVLSLSGDPPINATQYISIMDLEGLNMARLTQTDGYPPVFTPDGTQLIYLLNRRLCRINLDGSNQAFLTDQAGSDEYISPLAVSPDGQYVAFTSNRDKTYHIYLLNLANNQLRRLTTGGDTEGNPHFTPDSQQVIFFGKDRTIRRCNIDGADMKDLVTLPAALSISSEALSPDGGALYCLAYQNRTYWLDKISLGDGTVTPLMDTKLSEGNCLAFSADGSQLNFFSQGKLYRMKPDGTEITVVASAPPNSFSAVSGSAAMPAIASPTLTTRRTARTGYRFPPGSPSVPFQASAGTPFQVSADPAFQRGVITREGITMTNPLFTSLVSQSTYCWRVKATAGYTESDWSAVGHFTTGAYNNTPALPTPTPLAPVDGVTVNSPVTLTWQPIVGAASYTVEAAQDRTFSTNSITRAGITGFSCNLDLPVAGGTYYWHVKAINGDKESAWSAPARFFPDIDTGTIAYEAPIPNNPAVTAIFLANPDFINQRKADSLAVKESHPSLRHDGSLLAFASEGQIYTMLPNGTKRKAITSGADPASMPVFSPDGTRISFVRLGDIWTMKADGGDPVNLTHSTNAEESSPVIAPDGTIFFCRVIHDNFGGYSALYSMHADGSGIKKISAADNNEADPDVSPDGKQITFCRKQAERFQPMLPLPCQPGRLERYSDKRRQPLSAGVQPGWKIAALC